ncbi:MAG: tetratricopeptide repeat protein [Acidobacteriota bacterium]
MSRVAALLLLALTAPSAQTTPAEEPAEAALEKGDFAEAERLFRQASLTDPDDAEALVGWATALRGQERQSEALPRLRSAVDRWLRADALEPAAGTLTFLVEEAPDDAALQAQLGDVLIRLRRFAAARAPLERSLAARPDSRTALLLGSVAWENGDAERAAVLFRQVGDSAPSNAALAAAGWTQLGRLQLWRSRPQDALAAFERALELGGDSLELRVELARALAQLAEAGSEPALMERALGAYDDLVRQIPDSSQLHYRLARLQARAGNAEAARVAMARYRDLDRRDREATRSSGLTAARAAAARRHLAADEPALALEALAGEGAELVELRGLALLRLGRFEEAQRVLEAALQSDPHRTELRALLARAMAGR